jgi:flagellar biosynthetic protein FliR
MEIIGLLPGIYDRFIIFILVVTRIGMMFATFSLFRRDMITARIVGVLSSILAVYVLMLHPNLKLTVEIFSAEMFIMALCQALLGFVAGFAINIIFEIFIAFGQIVSTQVGISVSSLFDPRFGMITSLTNFYYISIALIFFALNGHLFMVKLIMDTFNVIPVDKMILSKNLLSELIMYVGVIFTGGVLASMAVIIAMLLLNLTLAVMTKFAPQINFFSIGINMSLILGLYLLYLTYHVFLEMGVKQVHAGMAVIRHIFLKLG